MEKPHGSLVLVPASGLCNMMCLGVSLPSLDGILVYHRLPPLFCHVALTISQYHFHSWEGGGTGSVKCLVAAAASEPEANERGSSLISRGLLYRGLQSLFLT